MTRTRSSHNVIYTLLSITIELVEIETIHTLGDFKNATVGFY